MSAVAQMLEPVCASPACGTVLSRYSDDTLCTVCRRRAESGSRVATAVDVDLLVLGLLAVHAAEHPGEVLDIGRALAERGIEADCWRVRNAVRRGERRHGFVARGVQGHRGYVLVEQQRRYAPDRRRRDYHGRWTVAPALPSHTGQLKPLRGQLALFDPVEPDSKR